MPASKLFRLALLLFIALCPHARASQDNRRQETRAGAAAVARRDEADDLPRRISAAETYQLSGDLVRAGVENRAVVSIALRRMGALAVREGEFRRAVQLLNDSLRIADDARARVDLAIAHMRLLELDRAIEEAEAALRLDAKSARAHHLLGKLRYMKGDYAGAMPELERALVLETDLDAAYTLGMTYLRLKQAERAGLLFEEMRAAMENGAGAHVLFGRAYYETGYAREAEREFRRALAANPAVPRANFFLGYVILQEAGGDRMPEAREAFERELKLHPQDFYSHFFLGVIASVEGEHRRAVMHLSEATRLKPDLADAYLYLGQSQAELGDPRAEASLRRAISMTADVSRNAFQIKKAHFLLGRVLLKAGRRDEAERELALARELQGRSLESSRQEISEILGRAEAAPGEASPSNVAATRTSGAERAGEATKEGEAVRESEAMEAGEVLITAEARPDASGLEQYARLKARLSAVLAQAYHNLGVIAAMEGRAEEGAEQMTVAAAWKPDLAGLDRNWGILLFRANRFDKALAPLSRHLATRTDDALVRRMLGVASYLTGDFKRAVETLRPLGASLVEDAELAYAYGVSLVRISEQAAAVELFARLAERHSRVAPARFLAAQGFMMCEDYERALGELRGVAELDPRLPRVHYHTGQSLIRLNRLPEAEQAFRRELAVNASDEVSKYHLAYVLLEQQREPEEALRLLREAIAARPAYADAHYQLGKALVERGELKQAIEHLETAARAEPSRDYIHYQLSIAYRRAARTADAERELQLYRELKAAGRTRGTSPSSPSSPTTPGAGGQQDAP
jgi:tetratricopeptide (TPR) repeat protein